MNKHEIVAKLLEDDGCKKLMKLAQEAQKKLDDSLEELKKKYPPPPGMFWSMFHGGGEPRVVSDFTTDDDSFADDQEENPIDEALEAYRQNDMKLAKHTTAVEDMIGLPVQIVDETNVVHIYDDGFPLCAASHRNKEPGKLWKSGPMVRQHALANCPDCLERK